MFTQAGAPHEHGEKLMCSDFQPGSADAVLRSIDDERRRQILRHLIDSDDEAVSVDELVVAMTDGAAAAPERERQPADRTRTRLHHVHLPKLAQAGIVDYDARSGFVRYRPDERVETVVRFVSEGLKAR